MNIINIKALDNYILKIVLDNGDIKYFDVKPYLDKGCFKELKNIEVFKKVRIDELQGAEWYYENLSLSKDTLLSKIF